VTDIRIITDRHTKRSKGLAYIEFGKQEEVFAALTLTGQVRVDAASGVWCLVMLVAGRGTA
jgi:RNA-binding protein 39